MEEMLVIFAIREVTEASSRECFTSLLLFNRQLVLRFNESGGPAFN